MNTQAVNDFFGKRSAFQGWACKKKLERAVRAKRRRDRAPIEEGVTAEARS